MQQFVRCKWITIKIQIHFTVDFFWMETIQNDKCNLKFIKLQVYMKCTDFSEVSQNYNALKYSFWSWINNRMRY